MRYDIGLSITYVYTYVYPTYGYCIYCLCTIDLCIVLCTMLCYIHMYIRTCTPMDTCFKSFRLSTPPYMYIHVIFTNGMIIYKLSLSSIEVLILGPGLHTTPLIGLGR